MQGVSGLRMVELPVPVRAFCVEDERGDVGFDGSWELHNLRVWVAGRPVVLVVGEPDSVTPVLLGLE